jgi:hypothetical protein
MTSKNAKTPPIPNTNDENEVYSWYNYFSFSKKTFYNLKLLKTGFLKIETTLKKKNNLALFLHQSL